MVPVQYQPKEKTSGVGYLQTYPQQPPHPQQMHPFQMQYPPHHQPMPQYPYPQMAPMSMPLQYRPVGFWSHGPPPAVFMRQQAMMAPVEAIVPHDNDVLMGRGGKNNLHKGNEKLREMAREERITYIKASKKEKSQLSRELVKRVHAMSPPGRFLKCNRDSGVWEIVDIEYAREKASQCLRDAVCYRNLPSSGASSGTDNDSGSESSGSRSSTPVHTGSDDQGDSRHVVSPEATPQSPQARDHKGMMSLPALEHPTCSAQEKELNVDGKRKFSKTFWEAVEILGTCQPKLPSSPRCIGGHIAFSSGFNSRGDTMSNNNPADDSFVRASSTQDNMPATVDMDDSDSLPSVSGHSTMFASDLLEEDETGEDPFEPMDAWPSSKRPRVGTWETSTSVEFDDTPLAATEDVTNDELSPLVVDCECQHDNEVDLASEDPFDFEFF